MEALRPAGSVSSKAEVAATVTMEGEFSFGPIGLRYGRKYPGLPSSKQPASRLRSLLRLPPDKDLLFHESEWLGYPAAKVDNPLEEIRTVRRERPEPHWFVAGYGVNRNLPPEGRPNLGVDVVDRLMSLFDGKPLVATAFADAFELDRDSHPHLVERYNNVLRQIFEHPSLLPWVRHASLNNGTGGQGHRHRIGLNHGDGPELHLPARWLSQGYQSSIARIADLVGWIVREAEEEVPAEEMEGLVLIDEIDLHLHPTWQCGFIDALREVFPALQFIATTHSPMVLPALEADEIIRLEIEKGRVVQRPIQSSQWQMTGTELYRTIFGIQKLHPGKRGELAWRYAELANDPLRTDSEESELRRIEKELGNKGIRLTLPIVERRQE